MPKISEGYIEQLYSESFTRLVNHVRRRHRLPREAAEELVQDAFLLACDRLQDEKTALCWLLKVIENFARNRWRKEVRWRDVTGHEESARNPSVDAACHRRLEIETVFHHVFGPHAGEALESALGGATIRSLAARFRIPEGTLYRRLSESRAQARL